MMNALESIARAALSGDGLLTRSLLQEWLHEQPNLAETPKPQIDDRVVLSLSAALIELLAQRSGQPAPDWAEHVGSAGSPVYLLRSASKMPRLREMCTTESPLPLRRRLFFAPSNYLEAV